MAKNYDFSGWATRNNLKCSDGRTIMKDAFKHNDGQTVPLVWNHDHRDPFNVLGHALLENRQEGVYAYCTFNETESGRQARMLVEHGDLDSLSIYANKLQQNGGSVLHGNIRELSLVLAGANPGAFIDSVIRHGDEVEDEAVICWAESLELAHADEPDKKEEKPDDKKEGEKEMAKDIKHADSGDKTVQEVFDSMTEEQKTVLYALIGEAIDDAEDSDEDDTKGGNNSMKHNLFDNDQEDQGNQNVLSHADQEAIIADAKRYGGLKDSALAHGITDIDYLFPDAKTLSTAPDFIQRPNSWVQQFMGDVHHTPFSRIKSIHADITADDARAKGYLKGNLKVDEVFALLKRTTTPQTVYKKQKLDRDDVIDITDFDVVAWLKTEMRIMLDEEIARAALVGDGRLAASDDKIDPTHIRPIWTDDDLYSIKTLITVTEEATADQKAKAFIRAAVKARKNYKGSGNPKLYTTEDVLTDCLLMEDSTGRIIYDSVTKLAATLRVSEIITVPVMEGLKRTVGAAEHELLGIIVNPTDYNIGADKGGAVNMFDDFDIDYNAQKYLIETRCSGALTRPYSAIVIEMTVEEEAEG